MSRSGVRLHKVWLAVLSCGAAVLASQAGADSGNLQFLKKSPIAYFSEDDVDLMMKNARAVLDSSDPAATQSWSNPRTGASGLAEVKGAFTATDGAPCKRLRVVNQYKQLESQATYTVCKHSGRGWVVNVDAQPAP